MTRHSALIITHGLDVEESLQRSRALMEELFDRLPFVPDLSRTELYAVAPGEVLKEKLELPHKLSPVEPAPSTPIGNLHHLHDGERWHTPEECPPAPADSNGAAAWQWFYYNALSDSEADSICYLWDVYAPSMDSAA